MEVLVLDGKSYVKASKAARDLGYATDYVGQLCRSGQIDAHLIGRTWYVDQAELSTYKVEKKRMSKAKAREYAKKTIEEHRQKSTLKQNKTKNIAIQYQSDEEELIPNVRKLSIDSVPAKNPVGIQDDFERTETYVEHEGDPVTLSGSLEIEDLNDGTFDKETTVLTPKLIRKRVHEAEEHEAHGEENEVEAEIQPEKPNFLSRLDEKGVHREAVSAAVQEEVDTPVVQASPAITQIETNIHKKAQPTGSMFPYLVTLFLLVLCMLCTPALFQTIEYDALKIPNTRTAFTYSIETTMEIIKLKI